MKKRINRLLTKLIQRLSDCDGMCGFYDICKYCEKNQIDENTLKELEK